MNQDSTPRSDADRSYEQRDVQTRAVLGLFAGVVAAVLIAVAGLWLGWQWLERQARRQDPTISPLATLPVAPPAPRLQATPLADYQAHRAREDERLATYGWIDRERGIARIPIDRAMKLLVQRGEPRIEPPPPSKSPAPTR